MCVYMYVISSALKERNISMSAKFGLPLPTSHLDYLNEEKENEERRAMLGFETSKKAGGGNGSIVSFDESHSLFLGGESVWSDTSAGLTKMEENIRFYVDLLLEIHLLKHSYDQ